MATDFDSDLPVRNDGLYDVSSNPVPSHAGLDAATRGANNDLTLRTEQLTSIEDGAGNVRALDVSLHDEAGEAYAASNPLQTTLYTPSGTSQTGQQAISDSVSVTPATSAVWDVNIVSGNPAGAFTTWLETTATAPNAEYDIMEFAPANALIPMYVDSLWASGSGRYKLEVWRYTGGESIATVRASGVQILTGFGTTATPNLDKDFSGNVVIPAGQSVYLIFKNLDNQSQTMYATLQGNQ